MLSLFTNILGHDNMIMEKKMRNNRFISTVTIALICVVVAGLSIAYATLSDTLNISGKATLKGTSWDIAISNVSEAVLTGEALQMATPVYNNTSLNLAISLTNPGDSVTYQFDVKNNGTIDARLSSINISGIDQNIRQYIDYQLTYSGGMALNIDDLLMNQETKTMQISIKLNNNYSGDIADDLNFNINADLIYSQK